jgi:hypothetical protein
LETNADVDLLDKILAKAQKAREIQEKVQVIYKK